MMRKHRAGYAGAALLWAMLWTPGPGLAQAGTVLIGNGAVLDTGSGTLLLGCHDLQVAGQQSGNVTHAADIHILPGGAMGPGTRSLSGDWSNTGSASVPGLVRWQDDCAVGESSILGRNEFTELNIASSLGRIVRFDVSNEQLVGHSLSLTGAQGAPLLLRSSAPGQRAALSLAATGAQTITHVDVADINARGGQTLAPGTPDEFASTDSGNNLNWFLAGMSPIPVPSLGASATWLLILLLMLCTVLAKRFPDSSPR